MKKVLVAALFAISLYPALAGADTVKSVSKPANVFVLEEKEEILLADRTKTRVDFILNDSPSNNATFEQIQRLAPKYPELIFVVHKSIWGDRNVWVKTAALGYLAALREWGPFNDDRADAYLSERVAFAKQEYAIERRIMALDRQIELALAPHASEIARMSTQIEEYNARFAPVQTLIYSEAIRKRLDQLTVDVRAEKPGAVEQWRMIQDDATNMRNAVDSLLCSFTCPLEEKIEAIKAKAAGKLSLQRSNEIGRLYTLADKDRAASDAF